jgi:atypical dual specificity phosphatase
VCVININQCFRTSGEQAQLVRRSARHSRSLGYSHPAKSGPIPNGMVGVCCASIACPECQRRSVVVHLPRWHAGLFLGDAEMANDVESLIAAGITVVMNVAKEVRTKNRGSGIVYCQDFQLIDDEKGCRELMGVYELVMLRLRGWLNEGRKVLVHCKQGRSRSAAVVLLYAMVERKQTLREACDYLYSLRNPGPPGVFFQNALGLEEENLFDDTASGIWSGGLKYSKK